MLMMLPLPWACMARTSCFMLRTTPRTLVSNVAAKLSAVWSVIGPTWPSVAALFTATSRRPNRATVLSTIARTSFSLRTSVLMNSASEPRERSSLTSALPASSRRPARGARLPLAAEKRLHPAQPSLSRQIRDLEYEVGVQLMSRSVHGIELTAAGKAFLDHARLALAQVDAAVEVARRAAPPARKTFAIGFQTGHEMNWLPRAMHVLRDELKNIQVTITSDYSPDLAEALVRGRLHVAFLRVEPTFDLCYEVVDHEPLIVLMPSDHRLTSREAIHPREFVGEIFIGGSNKATVLRAVTEDYLRRSGLDIKLDHGVDNMAMAMSLVASTRGLALMPAYAKNLLPWSVVSRPLEGEAPTIDVAVGYSKSNSSPILKLFLSRLDELVGPNQKQ